MGVQFYLVDESNKEVFELGKHFSLYDLDLNLYCNDEYGFKYLVLKDLNDAGFKELEYSHKLADALWDFVKDRNPKNLKIKTDGQLIDESIDFNTEFKFIETRYYLGSDPEKHKETLDHLNNVWFKNGN